jgi:DNA polymerase-3 subunit gamma/tau
MPAGHICYNILMSTENVLYRKYRPGKWAEVIGQDQVVAVLSGAIKLGNIAHAYLFAGSRGTGKTSVARILAAALGTGANDLYEIDGASSRGIDEIRELREAVRSLPFASPYKVYIIDEVHMLTKEAFNALLKTLEEPPRHVIFILATTEQHKLPETIVSRCQTFVFKKPSVDVLKKFVLKTAAKEGLTVDDGSANLIAMLGDGSFRDTLGILQKVISMSPDRQVSPDEIEAITGAPKEQHIFDLITSLLSGKPDLALTVIAKAADEGRDMKIFLKLALSALRAAMLVRFSPAAAVAIRQEYGEDSFRKIEELSKHEKAERLPAILKELLPVYDDIGRVYLPQLPLEIAAIRIAQS